MSTPTFDIERARLIAARHLLPEHFDEFQRLAKSVVHGPAFQIVLIDCADSATRNRLIDSLDEVLRLAGLRSARLPLSGGVRGAAAFEARLRLHASKSQVVHVLGGARWFDATRWDELNQRRERLALDARVRVVFWLDAERIAVLPMQAQDLWAWRSGVYAFGLPTASAATLESPLPVPFKVGVADTRSMTQRHRRVIELQTSLAREPPLDEELRMPLLDELGGLLYDLGELDAAVELWRDVELPLHRQRHDDRAAAHTMSRIADVMHDQGQLDESLRIRREDQLPVFERLGDHRSRAGTMGRIADVLQDRGQFDEALRIRREEQLPIYAQLGDQYGHALTLGRIADVLQSRGQLTEALRIRREEELPVYERLGDQRSRAATMGKIADALRLQGQSDEALRIYREEGLPVYERLGDQRSRAVTMGQIANVLHDRGQFDEVLRIRREEQLPVYERLGDQRSRLVCWSSMAITLLARGAAGDRDEARRLFSAALADAQKMGLPEVEVISGWLKRVDTAP